MTAFKNAYMFFLTIVLMGHSLLTTSAGYAIHALSFWRWNVFKGLLVDRHSLLTFFNLTQKDETLALSLSNVRTS